MAVKLVVIYPRPKDVEAFEAVYNREHVPRTSLASKDVAEKLPALKTFQKSQSSSPHQLMSL